MVARSGEFKSEEQAHDDQDQIARRGRRPAAVRRRRSGGTRASRADLNVRSGPGTQYGVVGAIQAGATVDVGGCTGKLVPGRTSTAAPATPTAATCRWRARRAPASWCRRRPMIRTHYDYYDYGYSYGPGVGFYAGPRLSARRHGAAAGMADRNGIGRAARRNWQGRRTGKAAIRQRAAPARVPAGRRGAAAGQRRRRAGCARSAAPSERAGWPARRAAAGGRRRRRRSLGGGPAMGGGAAAGGAARTGAGSGSALPNTRRKIVSTCLR